MFDKLSQKRFTGNQSKAFQSGKIPQKDIENYFYRHDVQTSTQENSDRILIGESHIFDDEIMRPNIGLLGKLVPNESDGENVFADENLFLDVSNPFSMVCVGLQGSGKSHTMNVVLENCLISNIFQKFEPPITSLSNEMCALVCHYDSNASNSCEAIGLFEPDPRVMPDPTAAKSHADDAHVQIRGVQKMIILCSPTSYKQRKEFYSDKYEVCPLLFEWSTLKADQIKKLMRLNANDNQLYVSVILDLLRQYQRRGKLPSFDKFRSEATECCPGQAQNGPLVQRLKLLENMVKESNLNESIAEYYGDLATHFGEGTLIIADLTDDMLSKDEANGIFQVLLEQFRNCSDNNVSKVVAFDEAHKYLSKQSDAEGSDGLASGIIDTVRNMRHENIRILISTQSPMVLPGEVLELSSITVCHQFQSRDWYSTLKKKIPFPKDGFDIVHKLSQGTSLTVSTKMMYASGDCENATSHVLMKTRPRFTADYGFTRKVMPLHDVKENID